MKMHQHTRLLLCAAGLSLAACQQATTPLSTAQVLHPLSATYVSGTISVSSTAGASFAGANLTDGNAGTFWSSAVSSTPNHTEWAQLTFASAATVNFVQLTPRYTSKTLGFPVTFTVKAAGSGAVLRTFTNFPTPNTNAPVILTFPAQSLTGIRVEATVLGVDDYNNNYFQLAELQAGDDPGYDKYVYLGNSGATNSIEVRNIGAGAFNPGRLSNWVFDQRRPLISSNNIYAPSIVQNGQVWNLYFGGWNRAGQQNDNVYLTVTNDNFLTFNAPVAGTTVVTNGVFTHVNNPSAIKVGASDWRMMTTAYAVNGYNKPMSATSQDGLNFSPNAGDTAHLISMSGYPAWNTADVNGGNVIYFDGTRYHLYFVDFNNGFKTLHATSTDFVNYTYQGVALDEGRVINDFKGFTVGTTPYYLAVTHNNQGTVRASVGTSLSAFPASNLLFSSHDSQDPYITSVGLVTDGSRLLGAVYGAGSAPGLDQNKLFAVWLQKKVLFTNSSVTWGLGAPAYGPDRVEVLTNYGEATGNLKVYDTDGSTLLNASPSMTIVQGDIWQYQP